MAYIHADHFSTARRMEAVKEKNALPKLLMVPVHRGARLTHLGLYGRPEVGQELPMGRAGPAQALVEFVTHRIRIRMEDKEA